MSLTHVCPSDNDVKSLERPRWHPFTTLQFEIVDSYARLHTLTPAPVALVTPPVLPRDAGVAGLFLQTVIHFCTL